MRYSASVFKNQCKIFMRDKGMLVFYLAGILVTGIVVPLFSRSLVSGFGAAAFLTTMWLKPMLAESLAGEREKKTLESLLSTSIQGKSVLWGKLCFHLLFALVLFGASMGCAALTDLLVGYKPAFALWQWLCVAGMAALSYAAIAICGTYLSATSADMRTANGRVSAAAYPLGLLFIVYMAVVALNQPLAALVTGAIAAAVYCGVGLVFGVRASVMKQQRYYENIRVKARVAGRARVGGAPGNPPKSQFETVLRHEFRYMRTLKTQIRNNVLFCFAPVLTCVLLKAGNQAEVFGLGYFNISVVLTTLCVPSATRNLVSFSIGGEKAYKTGESLLSTPLKIRAVFLAKCAAPVLVSAAMILLSVLLALLGVNIVGALQGAGTVETFSAAQFILLLPAGIMGSVTMIILTGALSMAMKTPRKGLYVATLFSFLLTLPPLLIAYTAKDPLFWSLLFLAALLIVNTALLLFLSGNIRRPWLMSKL